jgi:hypothetical protein
MVSGMPSDSKWFEYRRTSILLTLSPPGIEEDWRRYDGPGLLWRHLGVSDYEGFSRDHYVAFPGWYVVAVLAIYPVVLVVLVVRRRGRMAEGMCVGCGYDLRAQAKGDGVRSVGWASMGRAVLRTAAKRGVCGWGCVDVWGLGA